jgi:predicted ATPase
MSKKNELEVEAGEYLDFALFPDKFNFKLGKEEEIKNTIFYAFSIFIEFLSSKKFNVFIIENGHLLDKISFELLKYLSETVKNPLLFILSIRTPYYEENLQNLKKFFEIKLESFGYKETKEFVKKVLNLKEIEEEIFSKIYENTFGNPLNIINILNFIKRDVSSIKISKGFLDFARATIDRLEEEEKKLLAILACLGERFDIELISVLMEEKRIKLAQKLKKLLSIGILEEEENKQTYRFKSNIYREIILSGLLKKNKGEFT